MNIISYYEIEQYADTVDKDDPPAVLLSKYQALLYKRMVRSKLKPLQGTLLFLDSLFYGLLLLVVILTARKLLLLVQFHRFDNDSLKQLEFVNHDEQILLKFKVSKA